MHIYLPRVNATSKSAAQRIQLSLAGKETIVVVEDSEPVRAMAVKVLRRQGYRVCDYPNGEEALAALKKREYEVDLLLTDVVMPGMNGLVLAECARERTPRYRFVLELPEHLVGGGTRVAACDTRSAWSFLSFSLVVPLSPTIKSGLRDREPAQSLPRTARFRRES